MIVGTGVDILEVTRMEEAISRFGERFLSRVFTEAEIAYCNTKRNRAERFAARFAAKEAAMKALGTGVGRGVSWQHIEVGREPGGRPTIMFSKAAAQIAAQLGAKRVSLSLSHTPEHAIAQVILES
jgi:holo-[acyl-carrier protein] synthase